LKLQDISEGKGGGFIGVSTVTSQEVKRVTNKGDTENTGNIENFVELLIIVLYVDLLL